MLFTLADGLEVSISSDIVALVKRVVPSSDINSTSKVFSDFTLVTWALNCCSLIRSLKFSDSCCAENPFKQQFTAWAGSSENCGFRDLTLVSGMVAESP